MKEIPLTKGFVALVDDEDFERLNKLKWRYEAGYAKTGAQTGAYRETFPDYLVSTEAVFMHRLVMRAPQGLEVDHRFRDTLDNRKTELRLATKNQNQQNAASMTGVSRYKGVYWHETNSRWVAQIQAASRQVYLGTCDSELSAALAYDRMAHQIYGEFARLNFPEDEQKTTPFVHPEYARTSSTSYFRVYPSGRRFVSRVLTSTGVEHLGSFETAYDAAIYRDHHIEKHNLNDRMNFS